LPSSDDAAFTNSECIDRSVQTDAPAKPARPDDGIASDALEREKDVNAVVTPTFAIKRSMLAAISIGSTGHFRRTHRQSRRVLTTASRATP
jgi:hypothetical protein